VFRGGPTIRLIAASDGAVLLVRNSSTTQNDEHYDYNNDYLDQSFLPLPPTQSLETLLEKTTDHGEEEEEGEDDAQLTTLLK
jgi:hypothetical protein